MRFKCMSDEPNGEPQWASQTNILARSWVGDVPLGGGAPVVVQSMLNAPADDAAANLAQIEELDAAGCEIVRMAIPHRRDIDVFAQVCSASPLPVVADIHFDAHIARGGCSPRGRETAY